MHLLFITRKYPPSVGGMQTVSYELQQALGKEIPIETIAWGKSQLYLPYFYSKALLLAVWTIPTKRITHIHLGDAILAPLGVVLQTLTRKPVSVTIHGLDITYKNRLYQAVLPRFVAHLDQVICISETTRQACLARGIALKKCTVIGWGVDGCAFAGSAERSAVANILRRPIAQKMKILVTVGRLVPRKGVHWFIQEVMPALPPNYIYLVVGEGKDHERIERAIKEAGLADRVYLIGRQSNKLRNVIYNTADVFLMPNIPIEGDMEGFGMVALEASSVGLPVVASSIEGIKDAIIPGKTGIVVPARNAHAFATAITRAQKLPREQVRRVTRQRFGWGAVAKQYLKALTP